MSFDFPTKSLYITELSTFDIFCKKTFADSFNDAKTFHSRLLVSKSVHFRHFVRSLNRFQPNKKAWDRRLADTEALVNLLRNKTERPTHRVRERPTCPCVMLKIYQIFRVKNKSRKLKNSVRSEPFSTELCL